MLNYDEEKEKIMIEYCDLFRAFQEEVTELEEKLASIEHLKAQTDMDRHQSMTPEELELVKNMSKLEEKYFGDLSWREPLEEKEIWHLFVPRLYGFHDKTLLNDIYCKIDPELDVDASYLPATKMFTFNPDKVNDPATIVHEILHVYDDDYEKNPHLRDFWITRLYSRLQDKIPDLDERCIKLQLNQLIIKRLGRAEHGMFFLLKSLDLDLKLNLPLGEVYAYKNVTMDLTTLLEQCIPEPS